MSNIAEVQPRTLVVELDSNPDKFSMVLPTMKQECQRETPFWYLTARARYNGIVGKFIVGTIDLNGRWIDAPRILETILEAGYINPYSLESRYVEVPRYILEEVWRLTKLCASVIRKNYEFNGKCEISYPCGSS